MRYVNKGAIASVASEDLIDTLRFAVHDNVGVTNRPARAMHVRRYHIKPRCRISRAQ